MTTKGDIEQNKSINIKKGEAFAMMTLLQEKDTMKDPVKKKKVFTRILHYVAQGVNMSSLFPEMIMNAATKDYIEKKLVYQYLIYYAPSNEELALLCVNTFRHDFQSENPQIRGLALRSLSGLRCSSLLEYLVPCITQGLVDANSYVRAIAVMGCLKVFHFAPETFEDRSYLDVMFEMLRDKNPNVSGNCVYVLNEVLDITVGATALLNKAVVVYLLSRFRSYNQWHQISVLQLVKRYKPSNDDEMFDIMNLLEKNFRSTNSGVLTAVAQVFLSFTVRDAEVFADVCKRIAGPLVSCISASIIEASYVALREAIALQRKVPGLFDENFKAFFLRQQDPVYMQAAKLDMLELVANRDNWKPVIDELGEYILDERIGAHAVKTLGRVGIRVRECFDELTVILKESLSYGVQFANCAIIVAVKDILRAYPEAYDKFVPLLGQHYYSFDTLDARDALIFIIGEFGEHIPAAPYLLENFIETLSQPDDESTAVSATSSSSSSSSSSSAAQPIDKAAEKAKEIIQLKHGLLYALTRLLFFRAAEIQPILGKFLGEVIGTATQGELRDKALAIYRLLLSLSPSSPGGGATPQQRFETLREVFAGVKPPVLNFAEDSDAVVRGRVFEEWGSCSTLYGHPSSYFTIPVTTTFKLPDMNAGGGGGGGSSSSAAAASSSSSAQPPQEFPQQQQQQQQDQLLSFPGFEPQQPALVQQQLPASVSFVPNSSTSPENFKNLWQTLAEAHVVEAPVANMQYLPADHYKGQLLNAGFSVLAAGGNPGSVRLFVFSKTNIGNDVVAEVNVSAPAQKISVAVKSDNASFRPQYAGQLLQVIAR